MGYSPATERLIEELGKLPGIGPKTAERLAIHILRGSEGEAEALVEAIRSVKRDVRPCSVCLSLGESDPCHLCADPERDRSTICVVEEQKDLLAIERMRSYRGLYHVLGGSLSPLDGVEPDDLSIGPLLERLGHGDVREVILATNPTAEGDCTSLYLAPKILSLGPKVTRLARGIPSGSSLEFASAAILADAMDGRVSLAGKVPADRPEDPPAPRAAAPAAP